MASVKATPVREVLTLYIYYHFIHHNIPVLIVLIIKACEVIRLFHKRLKSGNPLIFNLLLFLTTPGHKNIHNLATFTSQSFSELH